MKVIGNDTQYSCLAARQSQPEGGNVATKKAEHVGVGDQAHDFTLPTLNGENVSLSDFRGSRVILFMWASW